ncbi:MAG: hypothetical protein Q8O16_00275 [Dehalococcoidia bacterium]|nr:hypothetical protein [Dehalococcoidia bacterium]
MRIVVFGREIVVQRISALMAERGVEVKGAAGGLKDICALHQQNGAVLAIVDSSASDVETACHYINETWHIPLVLFIAGEQADWKKLTALGASAYIAENSGNDELVARLNALVRRFWPVLGKDHVSSDTPIQKTQDYRLSSGEGQSFSVELTGRDAK